VQDIKQQAVSQRICLLSLVTCFHFSLTAYFTYDNEADRTTLGGCFAARCAALPAILPSLLLVLLGSHVRATALPCSSSRLACHLTSVNVGSTQGRWFCSSANASLDFVTIPRRKILQHHANRERCSAGFCEISAKRHRLGLLPISRFLCRSCAEPHIFRCFLRIASSAAGGREAFALAIVSVHAY
jgi:hypothetical protein